jgi:hypothetical protein
MEPKSHLFDVELAIKHGVNAAIMIQYLAFWIHTNKANADKKKHFFEERWWTFNSNEALTEIFPYWKAHQIRHILDKLVADKIILKRQAAQGGNRSCWYAFHDDKAFDKTCKCHLSKVSDELTKILNASEKNITCSIQGTDNYTDTFTDRGKTSSPQLSASSDGEQQAYQLLRKEGVGKSSAQILSRQHSLNEVVRAITAALMKAQDISTGCKNIPFKRAGYIVATLNQARSEGHPVTLSRKAKRDIETKMTGRIDTTLSNQEMEQRKQALRTALFAVH